MIAAGENGLCTLAHSRRATCWNASWPWFSSWQVTFSWKKIFSGWAPWHRLCALLKVQSQWLACDSLPSCRNGRFSACLPFARASSRLPCSALSCRIWPCVPRSGVNVNRVRLTADGLAPHYGKDDSGDVGRVGIGSKKHVRRGEFLRLCRTPYRTAL